MKPIDDIPEALRDPGSKKANLSPLKWIIGGVVLALAGIVSMVFSLLDRPSTPARTPAPPVAVSPSPTPKPTTTPIVNILGHLPYPEAPRAELEAITADGRIRLRRSAARAFLDMQTAARRAGVVLVPISGFRSKQEQEKLFFGVKAKRNQETRERAEVSAPPGYSEHHTGYAVDIGDGNTPATNLNPAFERTRAFSWLRDNAAQFSFELSFPPDNPQGISYEPWHWRFVGDSDSLETFYKAQQLGKQK